MYRFPVGITLGALLCSTALLSPLTAAAQTATPQGQAPQTPPSTPPGQTGPDRAGSDKATAESKAALAYKAFFDARLAGLHAGLQLTPDQAPLWAPVEAAIRDLAKVHDDIHRGADDDQPTDALAQLKRLSARLIRGGQAMKALADATGPLLATLSDDQKERLPTLLEGIQPKKILAKAFNLSDQRKGDFGGRDADEGMAMHRHHHGADDDHGPRHGYDDEGSRGHSDGDDDDREGRGRGWHGDQDRRDDWRRDRDDDRSDDHHGSGREHHGGDHYHPRNDEERT